jgi:hypothetical protein
VVAVGALTVVVAVLLGLKVQVTPETRVQAYPEAVAPVKVAVQGVDVPLVGLPCAMEPDGVPHVIVQFGVLSVFPVILSVTAQ